MEFGVWSNAPKPLGGALRFAYILHQATGSRGYTRETHLRGLKTFDFLLVHGGGLRLYIAILNES
ncbi:hypothetical protein [Nostoc sp.]|uniref:hypothetical protein n=1 Tax=Nostoc sp. TaxID=1180 RepID=UPI002FF622E1